MNRESLASLTQKFFLQHRQHLCQHYPGLSARKLVQVLQDCGKNPASISLAPAGDDRAKSFFQSLLMGMPLEYITGKAHFFCSTLEIEKGVFIPRSETEKLVEIALEKLHAGDCCAGDIFKIIDVGIGSGNILLSLLPEIDRPCRAVGVDVSPQALELAQRNLFGQGFTFSKEIQVELLHSDRLQRISGTFDMIVSNPPYIKSQGDRHKVHPQVRQWEPDDALYLEDASYREWFGEFFAQAFDRLQREGVFLMEGHEDHLQDLAELAGQCRGWGKVEVIKDYSERDRFLLLEKGWKN